MTDSGFPLIAPSFAGAGPAAYMEISPLQSSRQAPCEEAGRAAGALRPGPLEVRPRL